MTGTGRLRVALAGYLVLRRALGYRLDDMAAAIRDGRVSFALGVLLAPTGPIQEVPISSRWGNEFLILAEQFDTAQAATNGTSSGAPGAGRCTIP